MAVEAYNDDTVPLEVGDKFGTYLRSYASEHRRVEVHLFRAIDRLTAFVTKSPSVPVSEAHRAVRDAIEAFTRSLNLPSSRPPPPPPDVVYDGYSIGRSGSI